MRVRLATDGSEDAAIAARAATVISGGIDAELHVVHVLPQLPRYAFPGVTPEIYSYVLDRADQEARDLLDEQVGHIEEDGGRVAQIPGGAGGFLVGSVKECAEKLLYLLSNPKEGAELAREGKQIVRKRFLLTRLISDELELYADLIGATAGHGARSYADGR